MNAKIQSIVAKFGLSIEITIKYYIYIIVFSYPLYMMATASESAPLEVGRIGFRKMLTLFLLYTIRPCIPRGSYQKDELFSMFS